MNTLAINGLQQVIEAVNYRPSISIILPFEPTVTAKGLLNKALSHAAHQVETALHENYPDEVEVLMMQKLHDLIGNLNFSTHKKSIAIYLSPVFEKVLYLNISVREQVVVDGPFQVRDLVNSKETVQQCLLLLISSNKGSFYLLKATGITRIATNTIASVYPYIMARHQQTLDVNVLPATPWNTILGSFFRYMDNSLGLIAAAYKLPVLVSGTERMLEGFKQLSRHADTISNYLPLRQTGLSDAELLGLLRKVMPSWESLHQKHLLSLLAKARKEGGLVMGIQCVCIHVQERKSQLLMVERNYLDSSKNGWRENILFRASKPYNHFSCVNDIVDDIMEQVLANGGDVEIMDDGILEAYDHIALIQNH